MEELALVLDNILRERYCMVLFITNHLKYSLGLSVLFQEYLAHLNRISPFFGAAAKCLKPSSDLSGDMQGSTGSEILAGALKSCPKYISADSWSVFRVPF